MPTGLRTIADSVAKQERFTLTLIHRLGTLHKGNLMTRQYMDDIEHKYVLETDAQAKPD